MIQLKSEWYGMVTYGGVNEYLNLVNKVNGITKTELTVYLF